MSFIDKTWNVRSISPLAIPWTINLKTKIKDNNDDCHSLSHWEKSVTTRLRRHILPQNNSNRGVSSTIRDEGTHAQLRWMEWSSDQYENNQEDDKTNGGNETTMTRHLFINVVLEEDPCAQLALCFAQNIANDDPIKKESPLIIDKFGFVLTRGQRVRGLLPVLEWLESTFGCSVSPQPFIFSPRQISTLLLPSLRHNSYNDNSRPLELSFEVIPKNTGLETLSLTVPPHALNQLRNAISRATNDIILQKEDDCDLTLRTLEHFLWETFAINVKNFRLIRAANDIIVIASDGRCKFLSDTHLPNLFQNLRRLVQSHYQPSSSNSNNQDHNDDDDVLSIEY